jgi:hypothetical protein
VALGKRCHRFIGLDSIDRDISMLDQE